MKDQDNTKKQHITELVALRGEITTLEELDTECRRAVLVVQGAKEDSFFSKPV